MNEMLIEKDISAEVWREYSTVDLAHMAELTYHIDNPVALWYRANGTGHRVLDAAGVVHWVPVTPFTVIRWKPRDPTAPVQF